MINLICSICGHAKKLHTGHYSNDHTGKKINHITCKYKIRTDKIDDIGLNSFGIMQIGHVCSCHGFKQNTFFKRAIKKYTKFLKELGKKELTVDNIDFVNYKKKELRKVIKLFKNNIKENPKNLLKWQLEKMEADKID